MKKQSLAALAILSATLGMGATPSSVPQQSNQQHQQRNNEAVERNPTTVRQGRATALNPTGGMTYLFRPSGTPPKQYGQWLQGAGKQKWNRKKSK